MKSNDMFLYALFNLIVFTIVICAVHYCWNYFRENTTIKHINAPNSKKYKEIVAELEKPLPPEEPDFLTQEEKDIMIAELRELVLQ